MAIKDSKYVKINTVNRSYFIFSKVNEFFEEIDKNKYLSLVATNESKEIVKNYEELCSKIRDLIRSIIMMIMMKNIQKLNLILMMICLYIKRSEFLTRQKL